jgi:predicted molibdopterin-dependent oxidoreductase YjgC
MQDSASRPFLFEPVLRNSVHMSEPGDGCGSQMQIEASVSKFDIEVDGRPVPAEPGQTVAAALIGAGIVVFRHTPTGAPRGIFCGMGVCFDCLVTVDGLAEQRACMTPVQRGMRVQTRSTEGD